ncbi:MAG: M48 family metalloprotease [Candidatus Acidiferrales bacterium]
MENLLLKRAGAVAALALISCLSATAGQSTLTGTHSNAIADAVLKTLLATPLGQTGPHHHYEVILLNDYHPNAFTDTKGKVTITRGLFPLLDDDRGVWAAVIAHELGHTFLHSTPCLPRFESALRAAYREAREQGYDKGPPSFPDLGLGQGISELTLSRREEIQADLIGMMLMAEAGYQPGFVVLLNQRLQHGLGDEPGFVAMFSHHPRLETREQHDLRYYDEALDIFRSRWPDAAKSPGGNLPPFGAIQGWTLRPTADGNTLVFEVPFEAHNAEGMQIRVAAEFLDHDMRALTTEAKYRAIDGSLVLNTYVPGAVSVSKRVKLSVPLGAIEARDRKLLAVVVLMAGNRMLDVSKMPYTLPKERLAPRKGDRAAY